MNQPPKGIQDWIHSLESGATKIWIRWILGSLFLLALLAMYLFTEARNFSNPEAMDMAQVGRNLAMGRGYTTHMIRPLSFKLYRERAAERKISQAGLLQQPHPDLHNPPVYPVMLACLFKVLPEKFQFGLPAGSSITTQRPWPEMMITALNFGWLAVGVLLTFRLGRRLFDPAVGWMAAAVFGGTELFWRFASNGLPTPFLMVLVLLLAEVLTRLDDTGAELAPGVVPPMGRPFRLAALAGALIGIGFLTRYAFGWLLVPAVLWMLVAHVRRFGVSLICILAFALVAGPWVARNYHLSGRFLGSAYSALAAGTETFPESRLERHLKEPKQMPDLTELRVKFAVNGAEMLRGAVPRLGGNWITFLFVAGLVLPFRNVRLRRLRWFCMGGLVMLFCVEAMGRTHWSTLVPDVNGQNQLVLLSPLVFLFGTSLFFSLLESTEYGHALFRSMVVGGAWCVLSLPLLSTILPPRTYPLVEPTYRPDIVRELCGYVQPGELMMSDVPWSVAWYGDRDCIWLPLWVRDESGEDFFAVNDFERRVAALYISPFTAEAPLRQVGTKDFVWGRFYFDALLRRNLPTGFPLFYAYEGSAGAGHLFLADRKRW